MPGSGLGLSDEYDRGLIHDLTAFLAWADQMAEQLAGGPLEGYDELISSAELPPMIEIALNALANGIKARRMRRAAAD